MKNVKEFTTKIEGEAWSNALDRACLLYTSDAADEL